MAGSPAFSSHDSNSQYTFPRSLKVRIGSKIGNKIDAGGGYYFEASRAVSLPRSGAAFVIL